MRFSQDWRLLNLFHQKPNQVIALKEILDMHISQYGRAIHTFRHRKNMNIESVKWRGPDGKMYTGFKYIPQEKQLAMF